MNTTPKHTPTPWKAKGTYFKAGKAAGLWGSIILSDSKLVANAYAYNEPEIAVDNAAFIVRAVNAYERDQAVIKELLAFAKRIHPFDNEHHVGYYPDCSDCALIKNTEVK